MPSERKVAVVTGAGSGMGKALATNLISKGWDVGCLDVNETAGLKVANDLGPKAKFFKCNVADYDDHAQVFAKVFDTWGRIDAALLNAGIVDRSSLYLLRERNIQGLPPKPDLLCTDICWKGFVYGTTLAIHFMRKNPTPGGQIIGTASAWAHYGCPTGPEYSGVKAAMLEFARAAAPVLKLKDNITINIVSPGLVNTPLCSDGMRKSYTDKFLTPIENIVNSYNKFLEDTSLNGQFIYAVGPTADDPKFVPRPVRVNGEQSRMMEVVCEALFVPIHGEPSGLPDAI